MTTTAQRLAEADKQDGSLSLYYAKSYNGSGWLWRWEASINVQRAGRGISKAQRLRTGYGSSPDAAMRDLERRLDAEGVLTK